MKKLIIILLFFNIPFLSAQTIADTLFIGKYKFKLNKTEKTEGLTENNKKETIKYKYYNENHYKISEDIETTGINYFKDDSLTLKGQGEIEIQNIIDTITYKAGVYDFYYCMQHAGELFENALLLKCENKNYYFSRAEIYRLRGDTLTRYDFTTTMPPLKISNIFMQTEISPNDLLILRGLYYEKGVKSLYLDNTIVIKME